MKLPQTQEPPQEVNPQSIPQPQGQPIAQDPTKGANEAAANLGFVNTMQEHLIQYKGKQKQSTQASQEPQNAPQEEKTKEPEIDVKSEIEGLRTDFDKKLEDLKKSITGEVKDDIKSALTEEDAKE